MPYGKKSPAKMGHKDSAMKMESKKQEKYNLMHDNPVAKHASGGSWMSKHSKSAFQMGHSPAKMSPLNDTETPAERKARLRKENAAKLKKGEANLTRLKAEAEANKNKKKPVDKISGLGKVARAIKNQFGDNDPRN
jgi:hypothetical protein